MNADELIDRAEGLCRALRRPFPTELKAYARDWQRQQYDLDWCWGMVKSALKERRALWQVEAEVHRHHARLQREKDAMDLKAGEALVTTPAPSRESWWDTETHQEDVQS